MAAPFTVEAAAETQGSDIRGEKDHEPQDHREITNRTITSQRVRGETQETTPGGGKRRWGQVSVVTWNDSQPA